MLPKPQRLHRPCQFEACFQAQRCVGKHLKFYYRPHDLAHARLGLIVSKRVHKLSVVRHHLSRILRESFSQQKWGACDMIVVVRSQYAWDKKDWLAVGRETWQKDWDLLHDALSASLPGIND